MKNCIVMVHRDYNLIRIVYQLVIESGRTNIPDPQFMLFGESAIEIAIRSGPSPCGHTAGPCGYMDNGPLQRETEGWPRFDARTQMTELREYLMEKLEIDNRNPTDIGKNDITIEKLMSHELIQFISSNPQNEMVVGYIRRDLGLALPGEVQEKGSDAILKWVIENNIQSTLITKPVHHVHVLRIQYLEDVSGSRPWTRTDTVTMEMEVPNEVVNQAIEDDNYSVVESWMSNHIPNGNEVSRSMGDGEYGEDSEPEYAFYEICNEQTELYRELDLLSGN